MVDADLDKLLESENLVGKFPRLKGRPQNKDFSVKKGVSSCCVDCYPSADSTVKSAGTQTEQITTNGIDLTSRGLLDVTEWKVEETCFGDVLRGPCGDTLLPAGLLEEVRDNMKELSQRCDIKGEILLLKTKMYQEFTLDKKPPIYDPCEFEKLCHSAGAFTIFGTILNSMTELRHSPQRLETNKKRTVAIIYKLCYGLSQVCNWLQTDHALFLKESNLNQQGLQAEREMGNSCSLRKVNTLYQELAESNSKKIGELISEAIENQWQLVLVIDDYTSIHSKRRPQTEQLCQPKSMCTIVIKVFKNVKAISRCSATKYHSINGIDINSCVQTVSSSSSMYKLAFTYSAAMPGWVRDTLFNPELEIHRLAVHEYCENDSIRTMRQMTDVHLLDFIQLTLKSKNDFEAAFDVVLSTKLAEYLKRFLIIQPGDWPAQFYSRQIVYETLQKYYQNSDTVQRTACSPTDHGYATPFTSVQSQVGESDKNTSVNQPAVLSVIPCIGPLHISLNGRETVFKDFSSFFENIYHKLFPRSKLPKSPRPWRISLILEMVYGGWLFIREAVKEKFKVCKDTEYMTLLNLLDNYLPLVLTIYSTTFKLNNFLEYFNAMIRIWTMFMCLERHHYDKAPLVWIAMCTYWGIHSPDLYLLIRLFLVMFDEYPVENAHSIIRSKTNDSDTVENLRQKAKATFQAKAAQHTFKSCFVPPSNFTFSQHQLTYLKTKCADLLSQVFIKIAKYPGRAEFIGKGKS
ncbi:hypothetical protein ACROYT_G011827 [Oculina patagonica]